SSPWRDRGPGRSWPDGRRPGPGQPRSGPRSRAGTRRRRPRAPSGDVPRPSVDRLDVDVDRWAECRVAVSDLVILEQPRRQIDFERRQLVEAGQAEPLEELEARAVQERSSRCLRTPELDDETAMEQPP